MTTVTEPRTVAEIEDDIRRYTERLHVNCVMASTHWYGETEAKLRDAKAELDAATRQVEVVTDRAKAEADMAWLDAVQDIAPRVGTGAGAR